MDEHAESAPEVSSSGGVWNLIPEIFYDLFAVLVPGGAVLLFLYHYADAPLHIAIPDSTGRVFLHILCAYFIGHLLYILSTLSVAKLADKLIGSPRTDLLGLGAPSGPTSLLWVGRLLRIMVRSATPTVCVAKSSMVSATLPEAFQKTLRNEIATRWTLADADMHGQLCYELCRNYIALRRPDRARFIRKEQAYGEMFRALTVVGVVSGGIVLWNADLFLGLSLVGVGTLSAIRYLQARVIDAILVYVSFHVLYSDYHGPRKHARED